MFGEVNRSKMVVKKIAFVILIAILITMVTFRKNESPRVDLVFSNIEALASGEGTSDIFCMYYGSLDCPVNHEKVGLIYSSRAARR